MKQKVAVSFSKSVLQLSSNGENVNVLPKLGESTENSIGLLLHRPKRKMRQNKLNIRLYGYILYSNMRIKLSEKYKDERETICNKILEILDLDENNSILLFDLEKDITKQNLILDMKEEIRKYFAVSCLTPFTPNATCKRPYVL